MLQNNQIFLKALHKKIDGYHFTSYSNNEKNKPFRIVTAKAGKT